MEKDFLQSLDYIGFTARIKRLSDAIMYDARNIYNHSDLDIEPNWHIIFLLLKEHKELTVTEIAKRLRFSHPGIIKITKKMKERGYLNSRPDSHDQRKAILSLSKKSLKQFPLFEEEWDCIQSVIEGMLDKNFLKQLAEVESKFINGSISEGYFLKTRSNAKT